MSLYNVIFTSLTPLAIGALDADVSKEMSRKYPGKLPTLCSDMHKCLLQHSDMIVLTHAQLVVVVAGHSTLAQADGQALLAHGCVPVAPATCQAWWELAANRHTMRFMVWHLITYMGMGRCICEAHRFWKHFPETASTRGGV